MGGVAGGSVVDVEQRREVSGSSFEVLSPTKLTAVQLLRIRYNRRMTFAHACSEFATIAHNRLTRIKSFGLIVRRTCVMLGLLSVKVDV